MVLVSTALEPLLTVPHPFEHVTAVFFAGDHALHPDISPAAHAFSRPLKVEAQAPMGNNSS
jgi:hypothetical protein